MASNAQKIPLGRSLNTFAQGKVLDALQITGKALPVSVVAVAGSIVTVKFELAAPPRVPFTLPNVTIPMFGPEYIRYPTQVGDKGVVFAIDTYAGGISDLGGGTADLSVRANLTALVFFPIASKNWSTTDDPDAVVIYGPNGAVIRDTKHNSSVVVTKDSITITVQDGKTVTVNGKSHFVGDMKVDGDVLIDGDLTVTGKSHWDSDFTVNKNLIVMENTKLMGDLAVSGDSSLKNTDIGGDITQTGDFDQTGNMSVSGDGKFTGDFTGGGKMDVTGPATFGDTMDVTGDVTSATISLQNHIHSGVSKGGADSGPPVP